MVFVFADDGTLVVMLSEKDVTSIRAGRTVFVDERQLKNKKFNCFVVSLSSNDTASLEMIRQAGHRVDQLAHPEPGPKESRCKGCNGLIETATMFEGKCIVCWAQEAKQMKIGSN